MANIPNSSIGGNFSTIYPQGNLFRKRWGQIDWRKIASVDIDRVAQEMDFQVLQDNIMSVAFCSVEAEFLGLDPNFIKLFRLGQLIIEYLLHSQQYLSKQSNLLDQQCQQMKEEQSTLKKEVDRLKEDKITVDKNLKSVQKENRKRRKMIEAYQDMMNAGATGLHPCPVCKREFISMEYLKSHIDRRHPEQASRQDGEVTKKSQEELEARLLEQMMDRLHDSECQLRDEMRQKEIEAKEAQAAEMEEWKAMEQKQIMSSCQAQLEEWKVEESRQIRDAQLVKFEEWKAEERKRMMLELEELKKPILNELEHVHKENLRLEKEKMELQKALKKKEEELANALGSTKRLSHVGHLEGAKEIPLSEVPMEQQNEINPSMNSLKECVEKQMESMRTFMNKRDATWKKRISELYQYQQSLSDTASKSEVLETSGADTSLVTKELKSLKHKQKKQEQLLKLQQDELESLRMKKSSLAKSTTNQGNSRTEPVAVDPTKTSQSESNDSQGTSDEDQIDFVTKLQYSPMKHCPMIKTMFQHSSADMEKIREQTRALFCEALLEKNVEENRVGLKAADLEAKMAMLHQERTQRHSSFDEHRHNLCEKLEEYCSSHFPLKSTSLLDQNSTQKLLQAKKNTAGKPPKPSKILSHQQVDAPTMGLESSTGKMFDDSPIVSDSSADLSVSYKQDEVNSKVTPSNSKQKVQEELPVPIVVKGIKKNGPSLVDSDIDEESAKDLDEFTDLDESEEDGTVEAHKMAKHTMNEPQSRQKENAKDNFFDTITGSTQPSSSTKLNVEDKTDEIKAVRKPLNVAGKEVTRRKEQGINEDSPWDYSDEDSVKDSIAVASRITSSTPMKQKISSQTKLSSNSINAAVPAENVSLDSFDLSSSNEPESTVPQRVAQSPMDKLASLSKNATSQSALTNVSLDEFDLSDLSDIM